MLLLYLPGDLYDRRLHPQSPAREVLMEKHGVCSGEGEDPDPAAEGTEKRAAPAEKTLGDDPLSKMAEAIARGAKPKDPKTGF